MLNEKQNTLNGNLHETKAAVCFRMVQTRAPPLHPEPTGRISVYKVICFLIRGFHNLNRTKLLLKIPVLIHTYIHHGKTTAVLPN